MLLICEGNPAMWAQHNTFAQTGLLLRYALLSTTQVVIMLLRILIESTIIRHSLGLTKTINIIG